MPDEPGNNALLEVRPSSLAGIPMHTKPSQHRRRWRFPLSSFRAVTPAGQAICLPEAAKTPRKTLLRTQRGCEPQPKDRNGLAT